MSSSARPAATAPRSGDPGPTSGPDGRTARRDRNREVVLDAALELFAEGQLYPAAAQVAARSGVSLRSVFRYYEDTDSLLRAAIERHLERLGPLFRIEGPGVGTFDERLDRYVAARLRLYDAVAATARAALARAGTDPRIADQLQAARDRDRGQLEAMFAPELTALPAAERRRALAGADVLTQFGAMDHLVVRLGLSRRESARVLADGLRAYLAP